VCAIIEVGMEKTKDCKKETTDRRKTTDREGKNMREKSAG
jgi:hypothetical protein